MQRNTSVADRLSVRATGPPDSVKRLDLRLQRPLLRETLKMAEPPRQGLLAVSMRQPQATPFELLQASLPVKTKQQKTPDWPPSPRLRCPTRPPLLVARDLRCRWAKDFPLPLVRARRCSRGPGPCASSQVKQVARKCSPVARCGGHPIFARYRRPHTRRGPVDCGNSCSRSRRKRARRA